MVTYFTSDLHLGHNFVARKRGYSNTEEHDEAILETLKGTLKRRDVLWVLGDVGERIWRLKEVHGRKKLVMGNHGDDKDLDVFESIHGFIKHKNMWLSHCPIHPQELLGKVNLHGHLHDGGLTSRIGFPYICLSWEFWNRPVSLEEIRRIIDVNM